MTLYPESVNIDRVIMYLRSTHIAAALSPLHDKDTFTELDALEWDRRCEDGKIDPEESARPVPGQPKKPHYHLLISFGRQKKSALQVLEFAHDFAPMLRYVEPVRTLYGYTRYLCHLDDPEKWQYCVEDCVPFGGFDLSPLWEPTKAEKRTACGTLIDFCDDYGIYSYCDLVDVVRRLNSPALWDCLIEKSYFLSKYMEGSYARATGAISSSIDPEEVARSIESARNKQYGITVGLQEVA
jgi:hypothetical protein